MILTQSDEDALEKLHGWLISRGIPVDRIGDDLTLPSPFKERDKKRNGEPQSYVDNAKRLWVTIRGGTIRWQCWYTKGKTGKSFGGQSAWALSVRTGVPQREIMHFLGLHFNEEVAKAETMMDKVQVIVAKDHTSITAAAFDFGTPYDDPPAQAPPDPKEPPKPYPALTNTYRELWTGSPLTFHGEQWLSERGLDPALVRHYGLCWDFDEHKVLIPFWSRTGVMEYYQWYDHETRKYRYPRKVEGCIAHKDIMFGEWQHAQSGGRIPLSVSEGVWDACTILGVAIGGSVLTDYHVDRILNLSPSMVIMALDNDPSGIRGAESRMHRLKGSLRGIPIYSAYPPAEYKDWNKVAETCGQVAAIRCFAERTKASMAAESSGNTLITKLDQILR